MTAAVIPFDAPPPPAAPELVTKCSFCGRDKKEAKSMVSTTIAAICGACVAKAKQRAAGV